MKEGKVRWLQRYGAKVGGIYKPGFFSRIDTLKNGHFLKGVTISKASFRVSMLGFAGVYCMLLSQNTICEGEKWWNPP